MQINSDIGMDQIQTKFHGCKETDGPVPFQEDKWITSSEMDTETRNKTTTTTYL